MSRIYFHSPNDAAELRGSERAHASILCDRLFEAALGDLLYEKEWLEKIVQGSAESFLNYSRNGEFNLPDGSKPKLFDVKLNTALAVGNDAIKLLARLHAQCEIHCFVEGANRQWLADIIRCGRQSGVLRADQGWEDIAEFLVLQDHAPVVCSYSVCSSFPSFESLPPNHPLAMIAPEDDDERHDKFYELDDAFDICLQELRSNRPWLELCPENWSDYYFGEESITAFNLHERAERPA